MNIRWYAASFTVALMALVLTACGGSDGNASAVPSDCEPIAEVETAEEDALTALITEYPPYITYRNGTPEGPDGELLQRVAAALCLELDASVQSVPAITEGVQSGRADLTASDWYKNEERAELFELSNPVYRDSIGLVSKTGWNTLDELEGKNVGTPRGVLWTEDLQDALGKDNVEVYPDEATVLSDVISGRVDAGLTGQATAVQRLASIGNDELQVEVLEPDKQIEASLTPPVSVALIHKGNTALRDAVNQVLEEYKSSGDLGRELEEVGLSAESVVPVK